MSELYRKFQIINLKRCDGPFKCKKKDNNYWVAKLAEEVGEIASVTTKLERGFNPREFHKFRLKHPRNITKTPKQWQELWYIDKRNQLKEELADLFTILDIIAQKNNIDLLEEVYVKFNKVSDEMNCPQYKINI